MKRGRGLLVNMALSAVTTLGLLALLEGGARLVERRRPPRPPVADYIWDWDEKMPGGFYVMKSDAAGWPPWEEYDGDGLRDRTRPHEKADGTRRVAVLGDSVTFGAGTRPEEAFPQRLEARLQAQGRPVEVMNVALMGWSTRQERIAWQRIVRHYHPDTVLLAVCLNDVPELFNNLSRPPEWLASLHRSSALARLVVNAEGREIDSVERLFSEPDTPRVTRALATFWEEVRSLRREVEADGAAFGVVVFPFRFQVEQGAPQPIVQRRIAAFCNGEGLRCLDLLPALSPVGTAAFLDYDHLSARGADVAADAILASGLLPRVDSATELVSRAAVSPTDPSALAGLMTSSADPATRRAAAWAIQSLPTVPAPVRVALEQALRGDSSSGVRSAAAAALGASPPAPGGSLAALFDALSDRSEAVRHEVARALARSTPGRDELPRLVAALASPDDYVSAFAAWTLGNLGPAAGEGVPALTRALARERTDAVVAGALARIGAAAAQAVPTLVEALRQPNADRRWRAARTLGRIGAPAAPAVTPLAEALRDENGAVRLHAARALGRIGPAARPAAAALQRATGDGDESVRREARLALDRLG